MEIKIVDMYDANEISYGLERLRSELSFSYDEAQILSYPGKET